MGSQNTALFQPRGSSDVINILSIITKCENISNTFLLFPAVTASNYYYLQI